MVACWLVCLDLLVSSLLGFVFLPCFFGFVFVSLLCMFWFVLVFVLLIGVFIYFVVFVFLCFFVLAVPAVEFGENKTGAWVFLHFPPGSSGSSECMHRATWQGGTSMPPDTM